MSNAALAGLVGCLGWRELRAKVACPFDRFSGMILLLRLVAGGCGQFVQ